MIPCKFWKQCNSLTKMCFGCNSISIKGNLTLRKRCNSLDKAILYAQANKPDKWHSLTWQSPSCLCLSGEEAWEKVEPLGAAPGKQVPYQKQHVEWQDKRLQRKQGHWYKNALELHWSIEALEHQWKDFSELASWMARQKVARKQCKGEGAMAPSSSWNQQLEGKQNANNAVSSP